VPCECNGIDHGRAEIHRSQSTRARGKNVPKQSVSSTLAALNRKAIQAPKHKFRDLYRLINLQMLYESFGSLKKNAAPGADGVTYEDYEANLKENLQQLLDRLIGKRYRAPNVRRCYIPKGNGKQRPLGLPTLEDKIVQQAASRILESIYEADIKSFFDEVDHDWLKAMLEERIQDKAFTGLIAKWLKAGVLEPGSKMTWRYMREVTGILFNWLNRRSQRKSYTWEKFLRHWRGDWQIPPPKVVENWGGQEAKQREMPLCLE
jgi:retron-type reverse transcriptase